MPDRFYDFYNYPSWITEMWQKYYDLALSYKKSINELLCHEANSPENIYSERNIFPILFLFRHYLELAFKSLILKQQSTIPTHHKIKDLLSEVNRLNPNFQLSKEAFDFIDWIESHDNDSYSFRYPTDKKMNEHFTTITKAIAKGISLSYVSTNISKISGELEKYLQPPTF